jgi:hypothetical protein
MTRGALLALGLAALATPPASAQPSPVRGVPSRLRANRFLLIGRAPDGAELAFWLDNDGDGFIFADVLARYRIDGADPGAFARLLPHGEIPPPGSRIPVIARDPAEPLFAGIDGQLGASWFAGRVVGLDYRAATVTLLAADASPRPAMLAQRGQTALLAGLRRRASLDTAASVALKPGPAQVTLGESLQATTFISRATLNALTAIHPGLHVYEEAGIVPGIDLVQVPELTFASATFHNVWCTTRPNDDVFEHAVIDVKLGANAFGDRSLLLDGIRQTFAFR